MLKHDTFDLLVHSTDELESLLGEPVAERRHVHSWPFSAVELLTTASGVRLIYKAQRTPTFEPDFYERVRSPLLPSYRLLSRDAVYSTMLFEFVDAPLLRDMQLSERELVGHGRAVVEAIGQIGEDVPVYIDISSFARWREFVDSTLGMLARLVADERLVLSVARRDVDDVAKWTESVHVRQLIDHTARLTHGDLNPGNVFVTSSGYQVIDWQRPQLAPAQVDLAALLERTPYLFRHVESAAIGVFYFLRLFWAVNAKANLLPEMQQLFDWWSSEAIGYIRRAFESSP
jgi:hypothetical protein